jgi:hypothetical protein
MTDIDVKPGEYLLIAVDGTVTRIPKKAVSRTIAREIGAEFFDTVILRRSNGMAEIVMILDDTGMVEGKPVNSKATELYHSVCIPGTLFSIHGDVAIVNDKDFELRRR